MDLLRVMVTILAVGLVAGALSFVLVRGAFLFLENMLAALSFA